MTSSTTLAIPLSTISSSTKKPKEDSDGNKIIF